MSRQFARAVMLVAMLTYPSNGQVWDLETEFSPTANPSGAWSFGRLNQETYVPFTNNKSVSANYGTSQLIGWSPTGRLTPFVTQNVSADTWFFGGEAGPSVNAGEVLMHPDSNASVVRWTAPRDGEYEIQTTFQRFELNNSWQSGYAIQRNQVDLPGSRGELFSTSLELATVTLSQHLTLLKAETIDFVVDIGGDSTSAADGTLLSAIVLLTNESILKGDFNANGTLDIEDLNSLLAAIRKGTNMAYDLQANSNLDHEDRRVWVEELKRTYFGDGNLDGEFNSTDLVLAFAAGKYENGIPRDTLWSEGDWNGDADFDSSDLVLAFSSGGYESGPRAAHIVPEPTFSCFGLLLTGYCVMRFAARPS